MRMIDADALIQKRNHAKNYSPDMYVIGQGCVMDAPTIDVVPVVRCGECIWWQDRQVQLIDGSCRDYMPDEPWSVTCDVGINVGSHCTKHGFDDESGSWFWANAEDFLLTRGEDGG